MKRLMVDSEGRRVRGSPTHTDSQFTVTTQPVVTVNCSISVALWSGAVMKASCWFLDLRLVGDVQQ